MLWFANTYSWIMQSLCNILSQHTDNIRYPSNAIDISISDRKKSRMHDKE
jgi:hypothetical protein